MKIWTIANQKGGVGKTTTTVSLAGLLAQRGHAALMVDLDPQGSLSSYFRLDPDHLDPSVYSLFQARANKSPLPDLEALVRPTAFPGLHLMPASTALATLDRQLGAQDGMGLVIAQALAGLRERFEYVFIDCPPVLGMLMVNALAACHHLIIPVQTEFLALKGLERMLHTLRMVGKAKGVMPPYTIMPTMFDKRTRASIESLRALREQQGAQAWNGVVPLDTRFREASQAGAPVCFHQAGSRGGNAYEVLLEYLLEQEAEPLQAAAP
jgi:chromosome partitioning protein